jgi:Flp pilus assembly protein TadD
MPSAIPHLLGLALAAAQAGPPATPPGAVVQPIGDADRLVDKMRAVAANPRDVAALAEAAELSLRLGDLAGAASLFARADQVDPRNGRVKAGMASLLVHSERPGEALRFFDQAEGYGYPAQRFAAERGLAYDLTGDQPRAQRDYRLALKTGGDDETTRRLALSLGISGRKDDALALLEPLLAKKDRGAWRARAFVLAMSGDVSGAANIAQTMLPGGAAAGLRPFFERLPSLPATDRAFAVHFGEVRPTPQRLADARLAPVLPALPPEPARPAVALAAASPVAGDAGRRRGRRDRAAERRQQVAAAIPPVRPTAAPVPTPASARAAPAAVQPAPAPRVAAAAPVPQRRPQPSGSPLASMYGTDRFFTRERRDAITRRDAAAQASPRPAAPVPSPAPVPTPAPTPAPVALAQGADSRPAGAGAVQTITPAATASAAGPTAGPPAQPAVTTAVAQAGSPPAASGPTAPPASGPSPRPAPQPAAVAQAAPVAPPAPRPVEVAAAAPAVGPGPRPAPQPAAGAQAAPVDPPAAQPGFSDGASLASLDVGGVGRARIAVAAPVPAAAPPPAPASVATTESSVAAQAARPLRRNEDAILARIIANIAVPASELGVAAPVQVARAEPATRSPRGRAARPEEAAPKAPERDAAPVADAKPRRGSKVETRQDTKTPADRKVADRKAPDRKAPDRKAKAEQEPARIWVQVAGGANEGDLAKAWRSAQGKAPSLKGRPGYATPLRATNRVLTGPFKTDADARAFVNQLAKQGVSAFPFTSESGQKITRLPGR